MPYFQRNPLAEAGAPPRPETAATIVERATAILDKSSSSETAVPSATAFDALPGGPALGTNLAGLGDIQKHLAKVLGGLLELFAQSAQGAQSAQTGSVSSWVPAGAAATPVIEPQRSAKAGETISVMVPVANEGTDTTRFVFYSSDFISDTGCGIPSVQVTFSPRTLSLNGHLQGPSEMQVAVPAQSASGKYSALVQVAGLDRPCAVVVLRVE